MLFFSCKHKHWGDVDEKGFQYCTECHLARHVVTYCNHKYELYREYKHTTKTVTGNTIETVVIVSRCSNCGDIIEKQIP